MGRLVHAGLGLSSLVAHVLPYPTPTMARKQLCTRSCSNKHTHTCWKVAGSLKIQTEASACVTLVSSWYAPDCPDESLTTRGCLHSGVKSSSTKLLCCSAAPPWDPRGRQFNFSTPLSALLSAHTVVQVHCVTSYCVCLLGHIGSRVCCGGAAQRSPCVRVLESCTGADFAVLCTLRAHDSNTL